MLEKSPAGKEIKWEGWKKENDCLCKTVIKKLEGKERNFDGKSSIQIDPHDNNVEREDSEKNENRKKIHNNVNNQHNLEIINLKRRKVLDDIYLRMVNGWKE